MLCYQNFLLYHVKYKCRKFLAIKTPQDEMKQLSGTGTTSISQDDHVTILGNWNTCAGFSSTFLSTYLGIHWVHFVSPSTQLGRFRHFNQHRYWIPPTG